MTNTAPPASTIDELREQHPHVSSDFFEMMAKRDALQRDLCALRGRLAHLIGYYDKSGAVPTSELQKVLDALQDGGR